MTHATSAAPRPAEPGVPARAAALALLHGVLALGRPLDLVLARATAGLASNDRALAHALALAALRWLTDLDAAIDRATPRALPADARARGALRVALAGAWRLGTPPHAVVATALPLVAGGPRRLVHGVLGRLLREGSPLGDAPTLPEPWASRWRDAYGEPALGAIAVSLAAEPPLDLTLRDAAGTAAWAERLGARSLAPGHLRIERAGSIAALAGYAGGAWWVQDLAASLPAALLGVAPGTAVLDLCAAPGGKTMQLAAAGARVTALDRSARRLELVRDNLARTGLAARLVAADALEWTPDAPHRHILLDAPCSASGIARRHPDVLHLKAARDLAPLVATQRALLARAAGWLPEGGRMIYSVCSLEAEEGEAIVAEAIERHGLRIDPIAADELPEGIVPASRGWLRVLPGDIAGGIDGFFIARLARG